MARFEFASNRLLLTTLAVNGLACLCYAADGLVNHSGWGIVPLFLSSLVAALISAKDVRWRLLPLTVTGYLSVLCLIATVTSLRRHPNHSVLAAGLTVLAIAALSLQIAFGLQQAFRLKAEHNSWQKSLTLGGCMFGCAFGFFWLMDRQNIDPEWEAVRLAFLMSVFCTLFFRFWAPTKTMTFAENMAILKAAFPKRSPRPK